MNHAVTLFRLLGDETRYRIVCALYHSDSYVELFAEQLGLTAGTVCFHLKKLENAEIVKCSRSQFYMIYSLNKKIFSRSLESFFMIESEQTGDEAYRKKVIASFFEGEKLLSIPVQEKKRAIVLAKIMQAFAEDRYTEKEVNQILLTHYEDHCTLRRWLVEDGFMTREHEIYTVRKRI